MSLSIFIVDGQPSVRLGLRTFLHHSGHTISGDVGLGEEALTHANLYRSNVVIMDVKLPGIDGLETLQRMLAVDSQLRVLLYVSSENPVYQARGMALGARGLALKTDSLETLLQQVHSVAEGGEAWMRDQRRQSQASGRKTRSTLPISDVLLTQREMDVLVHLANGLTNKEIATSLGIGYETVKEHVQHVLRKLGVTDRTQAAVWAVRQKVV